VYAVLPTLAPERITTLVLKVKFSFWFCIVGITVGYSVRSSKMLCKLANLCLLIKACVLVVT
jgi:hypothetical protein